MIKIYCILNRQGEGLHYIGGSLFWRKPDTYESIVNFTPFYSIKDIVKFIAECGIKDAYDIGCMTFTLEKIDAKK